MLWSFPWDFEKLHAQNLTFNFSILNVRVKCSQFNLMRSNYGKRSLFSTWSDQFESKMLPIWFDAFKSYQEKSVLNERENQIKLRVKYSQFDLATSNYVKSSLFSLGWSNAKSYQPLLTFKYRRNFRLQHLSAAANCDHRRLRRVDGVVFIFHN